MRVSCHSYYDIIHHQLTNIWIFCQTSDGDVWRVLKESNPTRRVVSGECWLYFASKATLVGWYEESPATTNHSVSAHQRGSFGCRQSWSILSSKNDGTHYKQVIDRNRQQPSYCQTPHIHRSRVLRRKIHYRPLCIDSKYSFRLRRTLK